MICAWIETSRARDRLVGDDEVGVERERPGDADALALAAGELVRVAVGVVRVEPDGREQLADPLAPLGLRRRRRGSSSGSPTIAADGHPRVEAGVRVLEDHLHPARAAAQLACRSSAVEVLPSNSDPPAGRLVQPDDRPAGRALAAAGLADEPERLAAAQRERDAVDGPHVADVALEDEPLA